MTTQTIQLTPEDTLPAIQAKMRLAQADRVLFVVPAGLHLSAVELRVLRRDAVASQVNVALVTTDAVLRGHAASEGISTFRTQRRGERARWRRLRSDPLPPARGVGKAVPTAPPPAGLFDKRSPSGFRPTAFLRAYVRRRNPWWAVLGLTLALALILGGMLYSLTFILPSATITLAPASEPLRVEIPLKAVQDARLDAAAGIVPAQALSVQVSGDARTPTTGSSDEPVGKATGRVIFINRTGREITVPAGTLLSTATGNNVQFATTTEAVLPPNGRDAASVEALEAGPAGNARAGTVTRVEGPLGLSLLVANEASFSGGTTAKKGIVTEEDKVRLQEQLLSELKQQALERLDERSGGTSFVPRESVSFITLSPTFTPFVGEVSPDLYLSMSLQAVGLAADTTAAEQVALARLLESMPPGTRLISDTVRFIPGPVFQEDPKTLAFSMMGEGTLLREIDSGAVRTAVLGRTPEAAGRVLADRFALARPAELALGPDWLPYVVPVKLPVLPWRIRVKVDWDTAAQLAMKE
jgi:hypothetical protein